MKFIDETTFVVASGSGGKGSVSFLREKFIPRGGPDGGDGGRGGSIVFRATRQRNTLIDFRRNKTYRADSGTPGQGRNMYGAGGKDLELWVPVGTVIYVAETGERLADLDTEDATFTLAGGRGGKGNVHFKSSRNRTPLIAGDGEPGTEIKVRLELKLLADVGLLGFPNAGKSTFISRVSAAKPRVADYPFTTLVPSLGVVEMDPGRTYVIADIPGLVEGASEGVGLGHKFLRHVERCSTLLHLVSANPFEDQSPAQRYTAIMQELSAYAPDLDQRPQIVVLSQVDLIDEETRLTLMKELQDVAGSQPVQAVSSITGEGVQTVRGLLWDAIEKHRESSMIQEEPSADA